MPLSVQNGEIELEIEKDSNYKSILNLKDASDMEYLEDDHTLITKRALNTRSRRRLKMGYNVRTSSTLGVSFRTRLVI